MGAGSLALTRAAIRPWLDVDPDDRALHGICGQGRQAVLSIESRSKDDAGRDAIDGVHDRLCGRLGLEWRLGARRRMHGFDEWSGLLAPANAETSYPAAIWSKGEEVPLAQNAEGKQGVGLTDALTNEAVVFFERHTSGKPFLLVISYPLPGSDLALAESVRMRTGTGRLPRRRTPSGSPAGP